MHSCLWTCAHCGEQAPSWIFNSIVQPVIRLSHAQLAEHVLPRLGTHLSRSIRLTQSWFLATFGSQLTVEERDLWNLALQAEREDVQYVNAAAAAPAAQPQPQLAAAPAPAAPKANKRNARKQR